MCNRTWPTVSLPHKINLFCSNFQLSIMFLCSLYVLSLRSSSRPWFPVPQVIELYRLLAVGISLWNQFAVPVLFSVFWFVLFVVQLCSDAMSANASAGHQGIMFFLLTRCDDMDYYYFHVFICTWHYTGRILFIFCVSTVSLNVVPHRTLFWVWPSWCPISLLDCSTYASSTWEVMQLFRTRTSCTGEMLSPTINI